MNIFCKILLSLSLISILILNACFTIKTTPAIEREVQRQFIAEASFDQVWIAVIETFAELNLPILNMEKDSGLITTDWIRVPEDYADCGFSEIAIDELEGKFNVFVKPADIVTNFSVNTSYRSLRRILFPEERQAYVDCYSTGELEKSMNEIIQQKISQ